MRQSRPHQPGRVGRESAGPGRGLRPRHERGPRPGKVQATGRDRRRCGLRLRQIDEDLRAGIRDLEWSARSASGLRFDQKNRPHICAGGSRFEFLVFSGRLRLTPATQGGQAPQHARGEQADCGRFGHRGKVQHDVVADHADGRRRADEVARHRELGGGQDRGCGEAGNRHLLRAGRVRVRQAEELEVDDERRPGRRRHVERAGTVKEVDVRARRECPTVVVVFDGVLTAAGPRRD